MTSASLYTTLRFPPHRPPPAARQPTYLRYRGRSGLAPACLFCSRSRGRRGTGRAGLPDRSLCVGLPPPPPARQPETVGWRRGATLLGLMRPLRNVHRLSVKWIGKTRSDETHHARFSTDAMPMPGDATSARRAGEGTKHKIGSRQEGRRWWVSLGTGQWCDAGLLPVRVQGVKSKPSPLPRKDR